MADNKPNDEKKPDGVISPQAPATDTPKVVDNSAPADSNLQDKKDGDDDAKNAAEARTVQPGDPSVKVKKDDGTVVERDAKKSDLKNVSDKDVENAQNEKNETPSDEPNDENAEGGDDGQADDDEVKGVDSVKLENASGKVVDVPTADVVKRRLFERGFKTVKGQSYPDEVKDAEKAFADRSDAARAYNDFDDSDPRQSDLDIDKQRRGKSLRDDDAKPVLPVRRAAKAQKATSTDNVDQGENGQLLKQNGMPKKGTRLAAALNK